MQPVVVRSRATRGLVIRMSTRYPSITGQSSLRCFAVTAGEPHAGQGLGGDLVMR